MNKKEIEIEFPAFPIKGWHNDEGDHNGMTLRDYFAAKALSGYQAHPSNADNLKSVANWCYQIADAMIEAREQK